MPRGLKSQMVKKESVPLKITEMNKVGNFMKSYT